MSLIVSSSINKPYLTSQHLAMNPFDSLRNAFRFSNIDFSRRPRTSNSNNFAQRHQSLEKSIKFVKIIKNENGKGRKKMRQN